jgi:hypothetical protein
VTIMLRLVPPLARMTITPEMTPVVPPYCPLPAVCEVAVPFTIDDSFFDAFGGIPDCSVSFLSRAGAWSARTSHSGFVPTWALAQLSSDPDQAVKPLISAGIIRRVRNGIRIAEGIGLTVVNVSDVLRDIEREEAAAAEQREAWRIKKRGQRREKTAERQDRIAAGVTGTSPEENMNVPPDSPAKRKKPQVRGNNVPGDIAGTSPGTHQIDRSNQSSSGVGQINARARENPAVIAAVIAALCEVTKRDDITEADALRPIDIIRQRAEAAGKTIRGPGYFRKAILGEADPYAELLLPPAPPAAEPPTAPVLPGQPHQFNPDPTPGVLDGCLNCEMRRSNRIHQAEPRQTELKVVV